MSWGDLLVGAVAVLALLVAVAQLRWSQHERLRHLTQEYLRGVVRLVQEVREYGRRAAESNALAFYDLNVAPPVGASGKTLSDAAKAHLRLLDELDLLALGVAEDAVDGGVVREYLRSTYGADAGETIHFIHRLRICHGDAEIYDHLYHLLPTLNAPVPQWASTYTFKPDCEDPHAG